MKARELRDLTYEEVLQKREEVRKEIFNLRIRQATRQIDNPLKIRELRRDLARLNTIVGEHISRIRPLAEGAVAATAGAPQVENKQAGDEKQA